MIVKNLDQTKIALEDIEKYKKVHAEVVRMVIFAILIIKYLKPAKDCYSFFVDVEVQVEVEVDLSNIVIFLAV